MIHKLTKIIATIGPVSDSEEMIERLILAGVNIFRFNFKHNTSEWHGERIQRVNAVAARLGVSIGTLIDLQGPEIRITMPTDSLEIKVGDMLVFGQEAFDTSEKGLSISHPEIIKHLHEGQKLLADDGTFTFYITHKEGKTYLKSESEGKLGNRKSLNIPGADFPFPVLVERDFEGLKLAALHNVDFVALSFVRSASDLQVTRAEMDRHHAQGKIVAKIETQKAIDHLDEIVEAADALMVARGDLGVELPIERVPYYQKIIIKKCIERGIPVITATQMLQSMIDNPYPTRAEVSDIANATYDFTDAVMLSGETASGKYPLEAVESMARTADFNENKVLCDDTRERFKHRTTDKTEIISDAAYNVYLTAKDIEEVQAYVIFTESGHTARMLARFRPRVPVFAVTPSQEVAESLTIHYGVYPILADRVNITNQEVDREEIMKTIHYLIEHKLLEYGKSIIVVHGDVWGVEGGTSTVKLMTVA